MPLIRCPKCGQAYDIPGVIAVRLPNSIATCHCGEWLSGSKAALLARMIDPAKINQIDLQPYRVDEAKPRRDGISEELGRRGAGAPSLVAGDCARCSRLGQHGLHHPRPPALVRHDGDATSTWPRKSFRCGTARSRCAATGSWSAMPNRIPGPIWTASRSKKRSSKTACTCCASAPRS